MDRLANRWLPEFGLPIGVLVLGVAFAGAGAFRLSQEIDARANEDFDRGVDRVVDDIGLRFGRTIYGLNGAKGMYAANDRINRKQFRAYVQARDLKQEFPGVRGFGLIQRVLRRDIDTFVASEQADDAPAFAIRQLVDKELDDLYVIRLIEPGAPNAGALGLDIGSEEVRRLGAERAIETGEPTLSGNIVLVQDNKRSAGALLYVPLYRNGQQPTTPEQRRASLLGLLYAPIVLSELLGGIGDVKVGRLEFRLFDTSTMSEPVYVGRNGDGEKAHPAAGGTPRFQATKLLSISGRDMTLQLSSTPAFDAEINQFASWLLLLGGSLVSALLSLLLWQQATGRRRAETLARGMTQDLDRLAQVVQHTSNAVSIQDREMRIVWINAGFTRITGYAAADAIGKTPGELMSSGKAPQEVLQTLAESARNGTGCRVEILNRAKDGREYWIDTEVQPLHDATGTLTGFMEIGNDITDRRHTEQQLQAVVRDNQALLHTIDMHAIVSVADGDGRITDVNDAFCTISGYSREDLLGQNHRIINSGFHDAAFWCDMWETISAGTPWRAEVCNRARDGSRYWVDTFIAPFKDAAGLIDKYISIRIDITASKQAGFALRENENLMRLVTENIGGRVAYFDAGQRLQFANQATYDFFGGVAADRVGKTLADLVGEVRMARLDGFVERALQGQAQSYESQNLEADGRMSYSVVHLLPDTREGRVHGFVAMAVDVTIAKRAQEETRRADLLMRAAIDTTDAAFVLFDPDDRLVFCNDKYRDYYSAIADQMKPGVTFERLIRTGVERGKQPEAIGREEQWIAERMAAHRSDSSVVNQRLDDGRTLRIIERKMPDGHTVGFRLDISELVQATEAAQSGSRAKSQFLANMSHEIRTPMNAILGLLTLLRKTHLDARQADYALKTEKAARSLLGLLNDILDISKVESGKLALEVQAFRIDQLLRDLAVILAANLGDKPVEVLFDIDPELPALVEGDMWRLQQVLINLGGNAIKFTEQGEVVVSVKVRSRDASAVTLDFAVRDSGIGVAPEHHALIFSGFSQAEASTTRRFGGTGLGLAISSRLVEMMGGKLEVDSALGTGSRFHFSIALPVSARSVEERAMPTEALRVLVVDDNETARVLLKELGGSLGWTVEVAPSGMQALDMVSSALTEGKPWQVVLMDWQMPGMDGWQACQRIRNMPDAQATLVLMVTAHGSEALANRGLQGPEHFDGFLIKPVTASMLYDAVHQIRRGQDKEPPRVANTGTSGRLTGIRLLVAEDNATNQMVVRELLEDEGAIVEIVPDGAAAVRAVADANRHYDAVLMDLQMPVMDGFTATGRIRTELGGASLPIIAMTANAMASDREACLAAGMNDHVGKPFEIDHLVKVLLAHCGQPGAGPGTDLPQRPEAQSLSRHALQVAGEAGIDADAALRRLSGNLRIYHQLMRGVMSDLSAAPERLRSAAAAGDVSAAVMLLHTLRGQVLTMGADQLAKVLAASEKRLGAPHSPDAIAQAIAPSLTAIHDIGPGLHALCDVLDKDVPAPANEAGARGDMVQLQQNLQELALQLGNSDMAATDTIAIMRQRFNTHTIAQLRPLEEAVNALEFDSALRLCKDWLEEHTA